MNVEFSTEREGWNIYQLADGTQLRTKLVLMNVRHEGENPDGSPKYDIQATTVIFADVPKMRTQGQLS